MREPVDASTVARSSCACRRAAASVLAKLAAMHRGELRRIGPLMKRFFAELTREPA